MTESKSAMNPKKEKLVSSGKILCPIQKEAKSLMAFTFHLMTGVILHSQHNHYMTRTVTPVLQKML